MILARLDLGDELTLLMLEGTDPDGPRFVWRGEKEDEATEELARFATELSNPPEYSYSPSHGEPGRVAALRVQEILGGTLTFPETRPASTPSPRRGREEQVVY